MIGIGKNLFKSNVKAGGAVAYDPDAQAYFTANTAITNTSDKNAINTFYLGLKSDGIYTKIKAMYLPIWGSAASCKWNLVNPLDTNLAFRLTFHGTSWSFTSSGMTPTNSYADTYFLTNYLSSVNSGHISFYSRTQYTPSPNSYLTNMGFFNGTAGRYTYIMANEGNGNCWGRFNDTSVVTTGANTNTKGLFLTTRTASNVIKTFRSNNLIINGNQTTNGKETSYSIWLGAGNNMGSLIYPTSNQYCFSSIGDGLTDTEATNFYNRVQTLMTYFGINTF